MCGICGVNGASFNGNGKIFRDLLLDIESRGVQATGVIWKPAKETGYQFKKAPAKASEFLRDSIDISNWTSTEYLIGHTRYATSGLPTDNRENHPHGYGDWIIIHNGVIGNSDKLYRKCNVKKVKLCDSAVIPVVFNRFGFEAGLEKLDGWFSICAINKKEPDKIYLAKNDSYSSTLFIGKTATENMIFSSLEPLVKKFSTSYFRAKDNTWYLYQNGIQIKKAEFTPLEKPKPVYEYTDRAYRDDLPDRASFNWLPSRIESNLINNFYSNPKMFNESDDDWED